MTAASGSRMAEACCRSTAEASQWCCRSGARQGREIGQGRKAGQGRDPGSKKPQPDTRCTLQ